MTTFGTELLEEMERLFAAAKADNAQLAVKVVELEAQNRQLVLEVEALRKALDLQHRLASGFSAALMTAEKQLETLKAELAEAQEGAFRAACAELANKWEHEYWESSDPGSREQCAKQLKELLAQTPMDLRGLLQLPIADADPEKKEVVLDDVVRAVFDLAAQVKGLRDTVLALAGTLGSLVARVEELERKP